MGRYQITKVDVVLTILCACVEATGLFLVARWTLRGRR